MATKVLFYTSGTSWVVPSDWNNASNSLECIGGGAGGGMPPNTGSIQYGAGGGGGGGYSKVTNQTYTPGATRSLSIGGAGTGATGSNSSGNPGGNTYIVADDNATTVCLAYGGGAGGPTGAGSGASAGTGSQTQTGGNGGSGGKGGGGGGAVDGDGVDGDENRLWCFS